MRAEKYILALPLAKRKEMLEIFIQKFINSMKNGNEEDAEFYALCCKVVQRCIND